MGSLGGEAVTELGQHKHSEETLKGAETGWTPGHHAWPCLAAMHGGNRGWLCALPELK